MKTNRKYEAHRAARIADIERRGRDAGKYHVISDAKLARDLRPRTLADVYRENHAGRAEHRIERYVPRSDVDALRAEYLAWCESRRHEPHPASIDPDHPAAAARLGVGR